MPLLNNYLTHVLNQFFVDCDYNHNVVMVQLLDLYHQNFTTKK